jgi:type IV pilus assembly protein PilB
MESERNKKISLSPSFQKDEKIKKILLEESYISSEDLQKAEKYVKKEGGKVLDYLFDKHILNKEIFGEAMAEYFTVPFVNLEKESVNEEALHLITEAVAKSKSIIAFFKDENILKIGMTDPSDLNMINIIRKKTGLEIKVYFITDDDLKRSLKFYKGSLKNEFDKILKKLKDKSLNRDDRDSLIVEIVDTILAYAHQSKASDVHIEPYRTKIKVRFRIDGVMHQVLELPNDLHDLILRRIKILGKMRTDEHRSAQDGKLRFKIQDVVVDVRISIVPIVEGENVVMRLLSSQNRQFNLASLGFSTANLKIIDRTIKSPHGMILVTGPTGSGKTTTLYAVLKILNKPKIHVSTIEDPVEYDVEGISQIQVNNKTGLSFAKGLRAIVRQDPDIIMVGEIRDKETAGIAINSALTGHLVLSTLHTNNAPTTLPRLTDMNVEPYLVASTVNIVIAQRLVRKICTACRVSYKLDKKSQKSLEHREHLKKAIQDIKNKDLGKINFYKGKGCPVCGGTGYNGRVGIFELLEMSESIKTLIIKRASGGEIMKQARSDGMKTMLEDGLEKVLNGVTTIEEVLRSAKD